MDSARAFAPGHVTGFFTVEDDDDPTRSGSTGAGIAIADGVVVEVVPADGRAVVLNGERVAMDAVERVLDALAVDAAVRAETDLPVGAGFGVSGATALATALAANDLFERRLSENELATVAHGAEVQVGTGLGDVVAQARGGVPVRLEPGGPNAGKLDGLPVRSRVEYVSYGTRSTPAVLDGDTERFQRPGEVALSSVVREPTLERFMYAARRFARETDLLMEAAGRAVVDVAGAGGEAAMTMLGD
ncbi:MAG: pantoate kinase, partial [Halobacteriales archaeon]